MKQRRVFALLAFFAMVSNPTRSWDEISRNVVIGAVGTMAVVWGVVDYYYPVIYCGRCAQLINKNDQFAIRIDSIRPKCGHSFHPRCLDAWGNPYSLTYTSPVCFYCDEEKKLAFEETVRECDRCPDRHSCRIN